MTHKDFANKELIVWDEYKKNHLERFCRIGKVTLKLKD